MPANRPSLLGLIGALIALAALLYVEAGFAAHQLLAKARARGLVAEALAHSDRPDEQAALFRQARAADPTYDATPCEKGAQLERAGHWQEAAESFQACVTMDPRQTYAHLGSARNLLNARGTDSYVEIRTGLQAFLEETENNPVSPREAAGRRAMQELIADLEELLTGDNPHREPERYTADDLVQILLRPHVRGTSRYDGPRVPLRLGFHPGDTVLGAAAKELLEQVCRALHDGSLADCPIQIEGHADSREGRTKAERHAIAQQRAEAVWRYLVQSCGIPAKRLSVRSFDDEVPIASNETEAGRAANRRVELFNLTDRDPVRGIR